MKHALCLPAAGSTTPLISVSQDCPAFFEGNPCQWRPQFSPLPQATSRLSTKTSGTRLAGWRRKIPNLLLVPAESRRDSLRTYKVCFWQRLQLRFFPCAPTQSWSRGLLSGVRHPGTTLPRQVELVFSLVPYSGSHQGHLFFSPSLGTPARVTFALSFSGQIANPKHAHCELSLIHISEP